MSKFLVVSLLLGLGGLGGCGGGGDLETKMKKYRDEMCACTDKACADKVQENYKAWTTEVRKGDKPSQSVMEALDKIDSEYKACRRKLRDSDAPPATPPATPPAAGSPDPAKPATTP